MNIVRKRGGTMDWGIFTEGNNIFYTVGGGLILLCVLNFTIKRLWFNFKSKRYLDKAKKLRDKKYNGIELVKTTQDKRKKQTNCYKRLKNTAKRKVDHYFDYKTKEIPNVFNFVENNSLKPSKKILYIVFKNDQKIISKQPIEIGYRQLIKNSDRFDCLDQIILFLHHLPEALLAQKEYDVYIEDEDMIITYEVQ